MNSERISPFWVNGYQPFSANYRDAAELSLNPNLTLSEEFYYFPIPDNELLIVPGLKD